jgi:glycosyltransferase involved in cell wall biosynthesis
MNVDTVGLGQFGNQLIEAVAVGADAIVSGGTALAENVERFKAGQIIPLGNSQVLAKAICQAMTTSTQVAQRLERRRSLVAHVGPESVAHSHLGVYLQILAAK